MGVTDVLGEVCIMMSIRSILLISAPLLICRFCLIALPLSFDSFELDGQRATSRTPLYVAYDRCYPEIMTPYHDGSNACQAQRLD